MRSQARFGCEVGNLTANDVSYKLPINHDMILHRVDGSVGVSLLQPSSQSGTIMILLRGIKQRYPSISPSGGVIDTRDENFGIVDQWNPSGRWTGFDTLLPENTLWSWIIKKSIPTYSFQGADVNIGFSTKPEMCLNTGDNIMVAISGGTTIPTSVEIQHLFNYELI